MPTKKTRQQRPHPIVRASLACLAEILQCRVLHIITIMQRFANSAFTPRTLMLLLVPWMVFQSRNPAAPPSMRHPNLCYQLQRARRCSLSQYRAERSRLCDVQAQLRKVPPSADRSVEFRGDHTVVECRTKRYCLLATPSDNAKTDKLYQMRCLPFGIALTALTGPLPAGNLNVRTASRKPLWRSYSSTVPFLRPA